MAAKYQPTLWDYLSVARRYFLLLAGVGTAIMAIAVTIAVLLPPIYSSSATILVESQRVPTELVQATVRSDANERIAIIRQRVMTRENLLRIVEKYRLFDGTGSLTPSELVDLMRARIGVEILSSQLVRRNHESENISFKLSFEDSRPDLANKVANELVTLFLAENVQSRTARAAETTAFLEEEASRLKAQLDAVESRVASFKQEHANALPEHLNLRVGMLQRAEAELQATKREYRSTEEELNFLDLELASAKSGFGAAAIPVAASDPLMQLQMLNSEYSTLLRQYSERHPDVLALARQIAALEATLGQDQSLATPSSVPENLLVARVEAKIAAAQGRLESLRNQEKELRARIEGVEAEILQTPQVERGLSILLRDHENARRQYESVRAKQMSAQMAQNLEQDNKAERFTLLEPPLMPDRPIKPNRKKVVALGFIMALGGPVGLVALLQMLDQRIRGEDALEAILRKRPLVAVPYINTAEELARHRRILRWSFAAVVMLTVAALAALHWFYMPLDLLFMKLLARFS